MSKCIAFRNQQSKPEKVHSWILRRSYRLMKCSMQPQSSAHSVSATTAFGSPQEVGQVMNEPAEGGLDALSQTEAQVQGWACASTENIASSAVELDATPNPASVRTQEATHRESDPPLFARLRSSVPFGHLRKLAEIPKVYGITDKEREKIRRKNLAFVVPEHYGSGNSLGNRIVIAAVGTFGKLLLSKLNFLRTYRMEVLYDAIENREEGKGLLTVSNHKSVIDDPLLLSAFLPPRILYRPSVMRWGLCSLDICFQTRFYAAVCRLGKNASHGAIRRAVAKVSARRRVQAIPRAMGAYLP